MISTFSTSTKTIYKYLFLVKLKMQERKYKRKQGNEIKMDVFFLATFKN